MSFARDVWMRLESIHAVTYFSAESRDAAKEVGLRGFWMGYFGCRAAPLGTVGAGVVGASFYGFAPAMVGRAIPAAWGYSAPGDIVEVRARAAAAALRAIAPDAESGAERLLGPLQHAVARGDEAGRPLYAANRALGARDDPVEALWQACTTLREHRGDGHVAALVNSELDGAEAHVLFAAQHLDAQRGTEVLRDNRGWTAQEWGAAIRRLAKRGLLTPAGAITHEGATRRTEVEATTDRLAGALYDDLAPDDQVRLLGALDGLVDTIVAAGVIPFPNPMGLPARSRSDHDAPDQDPSVDG